MGTVFRLGDQLCINGVHNGKPTKIVGSHEPRKHEVSMCMGVLDTLPKLQVDKGSRSNFET